jgi:hypothetical protein
MAKNYHHLTCSKETKKLIMEECKEEFLKYNPQFDGVLITQEFILKRIALSYLDKLPPENEPYD